MVLKIDDLKKDIFHSVSLMLNKIIKKGNKFAMKKDMKKKSKRITFKELYFLK